MIWWWQSFKCVLQHMGTLVFRIHKHDIFYSTCCPHMTFWPAIPVLIATSLFFPSQRKQITSWTFLMRSLIRYAHFVKTVTTSKPSLLSIFIYTVVLGTLTKFWFCNRLCLSVVVIIEKIPFFLTHLYSSSICICKLYVFYKHTRTHIHMYEIIKISHH